MTGIIFVEVIRRFAFGQQAPWSSTIPIYLFLWVTWVGCAYTARKRSHLRFEELRSRMSYGGQFCCMMLDHIIWIGFSLLVIYYAVEQVQRGQRAGGRTNGHGGNGGGSRPNGSARQNAAANNDLGLRKAALLKTCTVLMLAKGMARQNGNTADALDLNGI